MLPVCCAEDIMLIYAMCQYCRVSEEEVAITRMLEKVLKRSDTVDREALCIVAGQRVNCLLLLYDFPCHH